MGTDAQNISKCEIRGPIVMILLLLGTNPYPFNRLLHAVDEWAKSSNQHVIAQTGHTPTDNVSIECHDFVDYSQIVAWIKQAEFVICQGGFGSIKDCMTYKKSIIAVPRKQEYEECQDSQVELVEALADEERVIPLYDVSNLPEAIVKAKQFVPPVGDTSKIPELVADIVEKYIN